MCYKVNINYKDKNQINYINNIKNKLKKNVDNPKIKILKIKLNQERCINIIQDGFLIAGTKQRVAKLFIKKILKENKNINTLLYAGSQNGFGSIATAYAAYKLGLKSKVFLQNCNLSKNSRQMNTLHALESEITICDTYRKARELEFKISDNIYKKTLPNFYIVPMGLNDNEEIMINLLSSQIKKACKNTILDNNSKKRIWLVGGSGGIAMSLFKAFSNIELFLLLTGGGSYKEKVIEWSKTNKNIHIIYKEPELNKINVKNRKKYYSSVENYDDLIFPYLIKYGKDGDFLWNVASDDYII